MAKPKVEKKPKDVRKLVREYWESLESDEDEMLPPASRRAGVEIKGGKR